MEFTLDYASLAKKLESQELSSTTGQASPQVYGQLLAIYLLFNDLTSAKFLWKRISQEIKNSNRELTIIWAVGKLMWKKNYSEIYSVINSCPSWPNHLKNIMNLILESTRRRAIDLISRAYSSIIISDACAMLGLTKEETIELSKSLNWLYEEDTGYLMINKSTKNATERMTLDNGTELIERLTDYVVFLESSSCKVRE